MKLSATVRRAIVSPPLYADCWLCLANIAASQKIIDVGVAGRRHSTGDASRHQDGGCPPTGWGDASRPPARGACPAPSTRRLARPNRRFRPADRLFWLLLRWLWPDGGKRW